MNNIYDFYNLIGQNIKNIRKKNGESQESFAEKFDLSRGFISHIESQNIDVGVSLDTLFNIAQEYNIDIRDFFLGYEKFIKNEK